jgi:hypothetical protein
MWQTPVVVKLMGSTSLQFLVCYGAGIQGSLPVTSPGPNESRPHTPPDFCMIYCNTRTDLPCTPGSPKTSVTPFGFPDRNPVPISNPRYMPSPSNLHKLDILIIFCEG